MCLGRVTYRAQWPFDTLLFTLAEFSFKIVKVRIATTVLEHPNSRYCHDRPCMEMCLKSGKSYLDKAHGDVEFLWCSRSKPYMHELEMSTEDGTAIFCDFHYAQLNLNGHHFLTNARRFCAF